MKHYLGIDLGGTNIAVGVVGEDYVITGSASVKTKAPCPAEDIVERIAQTCAMALQSAALTMEDIEWVGLGSPGIVNSEKGVIEYATNLEFKNVPLREMLTKSLRKPAYIANDAQSAGYGEMLAGGARGYHDVTALTLGTGVGGCVIIDGKLHSGFNNAAGELGHFGIFYGGEECSCHMPGCVESYCSATALVRQTRASMGLHPDSLMWELCDGDIEKADGRTAFLSRAKGDVAGEAVVSQFCDYLGYAVNGLINILQPQIVLIGGGISREGDTLLTPVREYCARRSFVQDPERQTKIRAATLGNNAGIIGAAFLGNINS